MVVVVVVVAAAAKQSHLWRKSRRAASLTGAESLWLFNYRGDCYWVSSVVVVVVFVVIER